MLRERLAECLATDDAREGLMAFLEKRAPQVDGERERRPIDADMRELVADLEARRAQVREMGGADKVAKQHARGKMTARERLAAFFDDGVFFEIGAHGTQMGLAAGPDGNDKPAGRRRRHRASARSTGAWCCAAAYDFTVKGGSIGLHGRREGHAPPLDGAARAAGRWCGSSTPAARASIPGSSHPDMISLFAGTGHLFREQVLMSGVVPQVAAMVGPGAAGTAYIPGLADYVPMVKGIGIAGARRPGARQGRDRAGDRRAGARRLEGPHRGERRRRRRVRGRRGVHRGGEASTSRIFPSSCDEPPPDAPCDRPDRPPRRGAARPAPRVDAQAVRHVQAAFASVVDHGDIFDIKPRFARSIITCLARIGGKSVGVVANQPMHLGGILDNDSADKAAHFIQICDAFNVPLVFLQDVPGFMVGSKVEHAGIIRHGAKMLHVMSAATVPKLTVVVRKAYGAGYYVMCGRAYEPDLIVSWPTGEISVMGAEGMVGIAAKKLFGDAEPPPGGEEGHRRHDPEEHRRLQGGRLGPHRRRDRSARHAARARLGPRAREHKRIERPARKRGVIPV